MRYLEGKDIADWWQEPALRVHRAISLVKIVGPRLPALGTILSVDSFTKRSLGLPDAKER